MVMATFGVNLRRRVILAGWAVLAWGLAGSAASAKPAVSAGLATTATSATAGVPTWQYQFEHFVPGKEDQGAAHSFEVPYVFGNLSRTGFSAANYGSADQALSDVLIGYWTNFAKRGDPNGAGLPLWPRYDPVGKSYQRLSASLAGGATPAMDLRGEICRLLPYAPSSKE